MKEGKTTVTAFDGGPPRLQKVLTQALRSRGNVLTLAKCASRLKLRSVEERAQEMVAGEGIVTDIDRGRALWGLLREAMDRLRPDDPESEPAPACRLYAIAEGVYIQGKSANEMATELGISPRTFHRESRAAVEALATVVWQVDRQTYLSEKTVEGWSCRMSHHQANGERVFSCGPAKHGALPVGNAERLACSTVRKESTVGYRRTWWRFQCPRNLPAVTRCSLA